MNFITGNNAGGILHLLGHTYNLPVNAEIREGGLTCAIRPERIKLAAPSVSLLRGIIESTMYLGSIRVYGVSVDVNGKSQVLKIQTTISQKSWNVGDEVSLEIGIDDIHLYQDES
jgi:ABC-type Fe3+/spermidine/putrescine transport system ATPase subunit